MKNALQKGDILARLPELALLADEALREKCINALLAAACKGGWNKDNVDMLPVSLTRVQQRHLNNQFDHLRAVTQIALDMVEALRGRYADKAVDKDTVIAGALLHDVGKFLEFVPRNGEVVYAENAKLMRHPLSGAIVAAEAGLPDAIVHIIAVHSFEGKDSHETRESVIVKMADDTAFKYITSFNN